MPAIVTFDPVALRIVEISTGGDNVLQVQEIYSEWKDWMLSDAQNMGHPPAFEVVQSPDLPSGSTPAPYSLLANGWKIRPAELDHRLTLVGNIFATTGDSIAVPTLGTFNVLVEIEVSPQALVVPGALSAAQQAYLLEVWQRAGLDAANPIVLDQAAGTITGPGWTLTMTGAATKTIARS